MAELKRTRSDALEVKKNFQFRTNKEQEHESGGRWNTVEPFFYDTKLQ